MHCGRSRYVKVINEDGASVTTKVAVKQLHYIPIMPRLKQLFLCEETMQKMRWHREGIHDSVDVDIMSHSTDVEAGTLWTILIQNLQGTPGMSVLLYRQIVSNLIAPIVLCTLAGQFLCCRTICLSTNV
jgi:hypothetical protein